MPNPSIKTLEIIPTDKLYDIHNDLRKYGHKWTTDQALELADISLIESFYTSTQYLNRIVPVVGAGLAVNGDVQLGAITAGVSLYVDYLITTAKENIFKSEGRKTKLAELSKDISNLYDRYQELICLLEPLQTNNQNLPELNQLLDELKSKLAEIVVTKPKTEKENGWNEKLGLIFWSLRKKDTESIKDLEMLKEGIRILKSWNDLSRSDKIRYQLTRLLISWRVADSSQLWKEWKQSWQSRQQKHQTIKDLTYLLQTTISLYQQEVPLTEIGNNIKEKLNELNKLAQEKTVKQLEIADDQQALIEMNNIR